MSSTATVLLFLRVGFSLAIVLAMIWGVARFAKRRGKLPTRSSDAHLDVVARRQLGRRGSLLVVETANRTLLVGVTDSSIALVADLSDGATAHHALAASSSASLSTSEVAVDVETIELPLAGGRTATLDDATARSVRLADADLRPAVRRESLVDALRDMTVRRI